MMGINDRLASKWVLLSPRFLPFADAATAELPLGRLLRLSMFQVSVGMALVLLNGTLNRVLIVEMGVPSFLVALMVSLPLLFAPLRPLIGFKSDTHRSVLGWKRVPYIWFGTMLQFGGLAIMPFALIILSGDTHGPAWIGHVASAVAFLLVGAGLHTTQTAGLALATDLAPEKSRPRVVAFLYVMLLIGMVASALVFGLVLQNFSPDKAHSADPGRSGRHFLLQRDRPVEAGGARSIQDSGRPATSGFLGAVGSIQARRPRQPRAARCGPRHRWLQHAGHFARALWR